MNKKFVKIYGNTGYFLRQLDLNTTGRTAMLGSMLHLQDGDDKKFVPFEEIYEFSLDTTGEKLETSSFSTLISKLHKAHGKDKLVEEGEVDGNQAYRGTALLFNLVEQAGIDFSKNILSGLKSGSS